MNPTDARHADGVRRDADPICCCGHKPSDHRGRYYALPTGTCAPGCSLCNCAWLCVMTFEFHALNDGVSSADTDRVDWEGVAEDLRASLHRIANLHGCPGCIYDAFDDCQVIAKKALNGYHNATRMTGPPAASGNAGGVG